MLFNYDSWNRMQSDKFSATGDSLNLPDAIGCPLDILHPDGEVVNYGYDCGGNLDFIKGQKGSETFSYVSALLYNEYGQRMKAEYGNGTSAKYTYDNLQHLSHLTTFDAQGNTMQDIDYTFDAVSNITMVDNAAPAPETDLYFYHPDHLGSASWITDAQGSPIQHLQYYCSPLREIHCISLTLSDVHWTSFTYGEPFVNQHTSNYMERFTFTGKERDEETGYGYFGARYMDHELMTMWLSVDPMADKYPGIPPYAYCAWNPVKLIDSDGREVYIKGDAAKQATDQLSSRGIIVTRDEETGRLSYSFTGKKLSKSDRQLMLAISSNEVCVNIYATNNSPVKFDEWNLNNSQLMGQFLGVSLSDCIGDFENEQRNAVTTHLANPSICQSRDSQYQVEKGTSMRHEITESYYAGIICIEEGISCGPSWRMYKYDGRNYELKDMPGSVYSRAHTLASPQADVRKEQRDANYAANMAKMKEMGIDVTGFLLPITYYGQ